MLEILRAPGLLCADMDDTVIDSNHLWTDAFGWMAEQIWATSGVAEVDTKRVIKERNDARYRQHGVHPRHYKTVAMDVAKELGVDGELVCGLMKQAVAMIYLATPDLLPEARQIFEERHNAGKQNAIVTHSPIGRARRIVNSWNLQIPLRVSCESTLVPKSSAVWQRTMNEAGFEPDDVVVVGDGLGGDIRAAYEAGVTKLIWIKPKWAEYGRGTLPPGVVVVDNLTEVLY